MPTITSLSGNEIYCLNLKGLEPGDLVLGNSVYSLGVVGSIGSGLKILVGGEVGNVTSIIHEGRLSSYARMHEEARNHGGVGITGVTSQLLIHGSNVEFLSVGSCVHQKGAIRGSEQMVFTSSASGQELYCQIDAGFRPVKFAFGNVAYSIGVTGGVFGGLQQMFRGEVTQFSDVFSQTRHLAVERIAAEARAAGANCVTGIEASIIPYKGIQEMVLIGTAAYHPAYPTHYQGAPATSDLTNHEMWNLACMGYLPVRLVLGTSIYSLGIVGGILASIKSLARGEIDELTSLIYEARESAIAKLLADARDAGADDVAGIKTFVYDLGNNLIEFMAIGTAVKYFPGVTTASSSLPCQAVIEDKDTFINVAETAYGSDLTNANRNNSRRRVDKNKGPVTLWDVIETVLKIAGG